MITAIIPVFGPSPWLEQNEDALAGEVDNAIEVDDGSFSFKPQEFLRLKRIVRSENGGFGAACNTGAEHAIGEWLLFVNSDVELLPGCVEAMLSVSTENTIVGAKLLYPDMTIQHGGVVYVPTTGWCDHLYRFHERACLEASKIYPSLVTGALLLMHRKLFERLGGFDTSFRMAFEDIDLELRALEVGGSVIYCGAAEAIHLEGVTRGVTEEQKAQRRPEWAEWEKESFKLFQERWASKVPERFRR